MKEVTEWDNNPREMWVWGSEPERKQKEFVIWIRSDDYHPRVVTIDREEHDAIITFQHCAEIEPRRRMTNKELSRWLCKKPDRECLLSCGLVVTHYKYYEHEAGNEIAEDMRIREGDGEWYQPLAEEEFDEKQGGKNGE